MPRGDRTGPQGRGAMSGRRAGYCSGYDMPGYMNPASGGGIGSRLGRARGGYGPGYGGGGHGWRNMFYATGLPGWMRFGNAAGNYGYPVMPGRPAPATEKQMLEDHAEILRAELDAINQRISEIAAKPAAD